MQIYLIHNDYIHTFDLNNVDGKYILSDYDSNSNERSLVNIECTSGKAYISSNSKVKIYFENNELDKAELIIGKFYVLKIVGGEQVVLYVSLLNDNTFVKKVINDNSSIKIGNAAGNDITYYGIDGQIEISFNGKFSINNISSKASIFVNNKKVISSSLNNFDRVFINGLKIVVCNQNF